MIKDSTGSDFLGGLYKGGMTAVDLLAQAAIPGAGLGFADDAARGLVKATTKADDILSLLGITGKNGDDVLKAIANTAGKSNDDIIKAIADSTGKSAEEVARIIANGTAANGDNAARMLASATAKNGTVPGSVAGQVSKTGDDYFNSWIDYLNGSIKNPDIEDVDKITGEIPPKIDNPLESSSTKAYTDGAGDVLNKLPKTTEESVRTKLDTYLLEPTHSACGSKAKWFKEALGFTKDNSADFAKQIMFDPKKAVQTAINAHGTKFSQIISVHGANGKIIVEFIFIKNNDGIIRLVTSIPTKR